MSIFAKSSVTKSEYWAKTNRLCDDIAEMAQAEKTRGLTLAAFLYELQDLEVLSLSDFEHLWSVVVSKTSRDLRGELDEEEKETNPWAEDRS